MTSPHEGLKVELPGPSRGRSGGLQASVQLVFGGRRAGLVPRKAQTKGLRRRLQPGLRTKRGRRGRARPTRRAPRTVDPLDCERRFLRLISTSTKTARAGPPAGPLSRPLAGQLQPGSLLRLCNPPPRAPLRPPVLSCLKAQPPRAFASRHLGAPRGTVPLIWGGRINPRVCRAGRAVKEVQERTAECVSDLRLQVGTLVWPRTCRCAPTSGCKL